jgi:hypothetical protein
VIEPRPIETILKDYRGLVLRWNQQINLVTRKDPDKILDRLLVQCREGFEAVMSLGLESGPVAYFDLGSGGGIPGIVWHACLQDRGLAPQTCLVEPREKRAWFLDRLRGIVGLPNFTISEARWGDDDLDTLVAPVGLISLKALKLTDTDILNGLPRVDGCRRLILVRYYPPGERWTDDLAADLHISAPGSEVAGVGVEWRSLGGSVLPGADFSLAISEYICTPGAPSS